jgi:hypothetical protein
MIRPSRSRATCWSAAVHAQHPADRYHLPAGPWALRWHASPGDSASQALGNLACCEVAKVIGHTGIVHCLIAAQHGLWHLSHHHPAGRAPASSSTRLWAGAHVGHQEGAKVGCLDSRRLWRTRDATALGDSALHECTRECDMTGCLMTVGQVTSRNDKPFTQTLCVHVKAACS